MCVCVNETHTHTHTDEVREADLHVLADLEEVPLVGDEEVVEVLFLCLDEVDKLWLEHRLENLRRVGGDANRVGQPIALPCVAGEGRRESALGR